MSWRSPTIKKNVQPILLTHLVIAVALLTSGCEMPVAPQPAVAQGGPPEPVYGDPPEVVADGQPAEDATSGGATATNGGPAATGTNGGTADNPANAGGDPAAAGGDVVKAEPFVGVVKRNEPGFITTPITAYFSAQQQLTFLQVRNGLKIFRSINGRKPKDFKEVQTRIINPRGLVLPELQPGDKYIFDPTAGPNGDVMVLKAAK